MIVISTLIISISKNPQQTITLFSTKENSLSTETQTSPPPQQSPTNSEPYQNSKKDSSELSQSTDQTANCDPKQIPYTLFDFQKVQVCLQYQQTTCIEKQITCSAKIKNLDLTQGGEFTVKIKLLGEQTEDLIEEFLVSETIQPKQEETFLHQFQVTGIQADQEFSCSIITEKIPTKC